MVNCAISQLWFSEASVNSDSFAKRLPCNWTRLPVYILFQLEFERSWANQTSSAVALLFSSRKHPQPLMGGFTGKDHANTKVAYPLLFFVSKIPDLNLLVRDDAVRAMRISMNPLLYAGITVTKADHQMLAIPRFDHTNYRVV